MRYAVRPAEPVDLPSLAAIEADADRLFLDAFGEVPWEAPTPGPERAAEPGCLLVAGRPPVGFAHVLVLEGHAHLEQLAVRRASMGHGVGSALLARACRWAREQGFAEISLCTFADLPWNGPYYGRRGFTEVADPAAYQRALQETERRVGLADLGRRIVMARRLDLP